MRVHIAFFWEPESAAIQEPFNLPAWNKPGEVISGEVSTVRVFLRKLLVFLKTEFNMGAKQRRRPTWALPTTKPVQREILNLPLPHPCTSPRTSLMSSKTMFIFPLCTHTVYVCTIALLSLYAAMIGVCVLFLGVCHREVRRQQLTVRNTIHLGVIWVGEPVLQTWHLSSQI